MMNHAKMPLIMGAAMGPMMLWMVHPFVTGQAAGPTGWAL